MIYPEYVYFRGSGVRNLKFPIPRYPVTVIGKRSPKAVRQGSRSLCGTRVLDGKAGGLTAHKPGDFDIRRVSLEPASFSGFGDWALRKIPFTNPVFFSLPQSCKGRSMFSFFSVHRAKRFLSVGFVFLAMAAIITGCNTDPEPDPVPTPSGTSALLPDGLLGTWDCGYGDKYEITRGWDTETVKYISYTPGWEFETVGTVRSVSRFNNTSGVIIIEYTNGAPDPSRPFTAVGYEDLKPTTVLLAGVFNPDYSYADTATLAEAKSKFTVDTLGTYIDWSFVQPYYRVE
jgi:hypothetical protein